MMRIKLRSLGKEWIFREMKEDGNWEQFQMIFSDMMKQVHDIDKSGKHLYFYYDESNNIRNYRLKSTGFNNDNVNFSLAGIVTDGITVFSKENLLDELGFSKNNNFSEFKFKHFIKKDGTNIFEQIDTDKFLALFKFIDNNNMYIHVSVLNVFYYGIVDIVDDITHNTLGQITKCKIDQLKDFVYSKMILEYDKFATLFYEFHYPNIKPGQSIQFLTILKLFFETISLNIETEKSLCDDWLKCLELKIKIISEGKDEIALLSDNTDDELIKNFSELYYTKLFVYNNSKHLFDREDVISKYWKKIGLLTPSSSQNFDFIDSQKDVMLQISDVIAGTFAKLFDYMSTNSVETILSTVDNMDKNSRVYKNLELFIHLIEKTNNFDSFLLSFSIPTSLKIKFDKLYQYFL